MHFSSIYAAGEATSQNVSTNVCRAQICLCVTPGSQFNMIVNLFFPIGSKLASSFQLITNLLVQLWRETGFTGLPRLVCKRGGS